MAARLGVLLINLGGPERIEDVKPFLFNLFSDPDIIRIRNDRLRKLVAWSIATTRRKTSEGYYQKIGGGSPLRKLTEAQAAALAASLAERGIQARVFVGMQCWQPTIDDAVQRIAEARIDRLVVLPLYPQFSVTTTGSALRVLHEAMRRRGLDRMDRRVIRQWYDHPGYVSVLAASVKRALDGFPDRDVGATHIIYSAHSIPQRYVDEGDPYLVQTVRTVTLVEDAIGRRHPSILAFQSKVGPVRWLEPSTNDAIADIGRRHYNQLLIVPVSFVSDHIETLYEIDILYRDLAASAGILQFRRTPSLNTAADFIEALRDLVVGAVTAMDEAETPLPDDPLA